MTVNKRKKNSRQRGSWTHGWGSKKKHRGAGHRGGRGNAGSGKRGDAKKPSFNIKEYFGKNGFKPRKKKPLLTTINISKLELMLDYLLEQGKIKKEKDLFVVSLTELGFDKLLGTGKVTKKMDITVDFASQKAIAKIESAGGKVNLSLMPPESEKINLEKSSTDTES